MQKKGLSTIVITLIIILISLVAVGIIWVVVRNVIQTGTKEVTIGQFTLDAKIKDVNVYNFSNNVSFTVKRNAGVGEFSKMNFVFSDGQDSEVITQPVSLNELEEKSFTFHLGTINVSELKSISIFPYVKQDEKEILGNILDKYTVTSGSSIIPTNCTPLINNYCSTMGYVCGDWGNGTCSGNVNCGTCGTGTCNASGSCVMQTAFYELPDGSCPSDCRKIIWSTGLDPEGGIPNYPIGKNAVINYGADNTGVSDATTAISNCLTNTASQTACYLPAGTYRLNSGINIPSNKVLRGAGAGLTTLMIYGSNGLGFSGSYTWGSSIDVYTDPNKNDNTLTLTGTSLELVVNDWVSVYQDNDVSIPVDTKTATWICDSSYYGGVNADHCMQQYAKVTSVTESAGNTIIGINRPLYYDYDDTINDMEVREVAWGSIKAGIEDLKVDGTNVDIGLIGIYGARHCWLKGIETYMAGSNNNDAHVRVRWSHGLEIRDSYFHGGHGYGSGSNYGFMAINWNSDLKIENNIYYDLRHGVVFEGGASGSAVLYNFFDDHVDPDWTTFLQADMNIVHSAHPFMNLIEGNDGAKMRLDWVWGSSSHNVIFRNHIRGENTVPESNGLWAIDLQTNNTYNSVVGNVIGMPTWTTGTLLADGNCNPSQPVAYRFGCNGNPGSYTDSRVATTTLKHGNYDYLTDGVAYWDGGSNHNLPASLYYNSKPAFFGITTWPPIGPDVSGYVFDIPAKQRFDAMI